AWGNPHGSYNPKHEAAMLFEEVLEPIISSDYDVDNFQTDEMNYLFGGLAPRALSREFFNNTKLSFHPEVEHFDHFLDIIYIAIGGMHKMGLSPEQIHRGLEIVHTANAQKAGHKDATGKIIKPENFKEPQPYLQAILDNREMDKS
ncbi:MAG: hypothetical protein U9N61_09805, partial [Euryarchaeota archaeon]|nr:hypothetical protein [Euryarchaeota archaeon]